MQVVPDAEQPREGAPRRPFRRVLAAALGVLSLITASLLLAAPAGAATDSAQLTLTGLSDSANPAGGSQIGVHPNDYVKLGASAAPTSTAKDLASKLGLGGLLSSLLGSVDFQVKADFSRLPGGASNTVLKDGASKTFHFTKNGTYYFTWQAEKVTTSLLGTKTELITFDGNTAKKLGIELNASNTYVGAIVVATNPPKGGISVQLPTVNLHPKVGGVQLPKVKVPGVRLPTVRVPVPDLTKKASKPPSKSTSSSSSSSSSSQSSLSNQALPVPARVLRGLGNSSGGGGAGSGGYYAGSVSGMSPLGNGQSLSLGNAGSSGGSSGSGSSGSSGTSRAADLAANRQQPSAQLPVVLAIIAIIALSLVAATYARLFLLRRNSAA